MTGSRSGMGPVDEPAAEVERELHAGMPRWVKVSLILALAVVLLFVVAKVMGAGGDHGPGRHAGGGASLSSVAEGGGGGRSPSTTTP